MTSQRVANTPIFCPDMSAFITFSSEYNKDINLFSNKICTFYLNYFVRPPGTISILVSQNVKPPQHASSPTEIIFPNQQRSVPVCQLLPIRINTIRKIKVSCMHRYAAASDLRDSWARGRISRQSWPFSAVKLIKPT